MFFDPALAESFAYLRKRGGHTLSKGRFLGAQMEAYLKEGLVAAAGRARQRRGETVERAAFGARPASGIAWPTEANEVFAVAPDATVAAWRAAGAKFYEWSTGSLAPERAPRRRARRWSGW